MRSTSHSPSRSGSQILIRSGSQSPSRKQPSHVTGSKRSNPWSTVQTKLSRPMKARSKKYHLSDIDEICRTGFSDNFGDDFSFYLRQDKETFLSRHYFGDDSSVRQPFVVDDVDLDDDHQMALPVIFGLTCPHPSDQQANAHSQVVNNGFLSCSTNYQACLALVRAIVPRFD